MTNFLPVNDNAVAAIRISSLKQGLQGDSPEAQKEQIERFAQTHNITIKKFFIFMESASKEEQPVQEAIDYCKNPKNGIQLFIIKSIDRFTRGGSYLYDHLKMQLVKENVKLIDIYGIIGSQDVNTLEHLGVEYNWSVYSPTKKSEILEAERAKDEMRDIMTRMIGVEIRYVRLGFLVRQPPFGYVNEKVETTHGKRVILKPHPTESLWIAKMFELRARGSMSDHEVVEEINNLGYKSRIQYWRNPQDRTKIIGEKGGNPLSLKQFWSSIQKPIYAGVNVEKWTNGQPVKGKFEGIVSIELFNKANKGKIILTENNGEIRIWKNKPADWLLKKAVKNPDFPYKRYVLCPHCNKPLFGSASRGRSGKHYPAYHCNTRTLF
jgi:site-specific DNA recombinase